MSDSDKVPSIVETLMETNSNAAKSYLQVLRVLKDLESTGLQLRQTA